ncbi:MAG: hypothetical protein IJV22_04620 [Bacteroidales bacterium]|nr:hypothetical protein [Bacteroidales bacterium]
MKTKLISRLRRLFFVRYRLTVQYRGAANTQNLYFQNSRGLRTMASSLPNVVYWSLYKRGPLGLPEREVDCSLWHNH